MSWDSIVETAMKRYWELLQEFFSTVQENGYTRYMNEVTEKFSAGPFNWDIFEPTQYAFDLNSGTQHLMSLIFAGGALKAM